jgi:hypothetical protein
LTRGEFDHTDRDRQKEGIKSIVHKLHGMKPRQAEQRKSILKAMLSEDMERFTRKSSKEKI